MAQRKYVLRAAGEVFEAIVDRVSISLALSRDRKWRTISDDSRPSVCLCGEQCDGIIPIANSAAIKKQTCASPGILEQGLSIRIF